MGFDLYRFITEIENREAIWNMKSDMYTKRTEKVRQWDEIVNIFSEAESSDEDRRKLSESLQKRWRNLRDCFMRECRRLSTLKGKAAVSPKITYKYYNRLLFLKPFALKSNFQSSAGPSNPKIEEPADEPPDSDAPPNKKNKKGQDVMEDIGVELVNALKTTIQQKSAEEDPDRQFLLSLLEDFKKVPQEMKPLVKINILKCIMEGVQSEQTFGNYNIVCKVEADTD